MAFIWGEGGEQLTPEQIKRRRDLAEKMMERGSDYSPVQHWTQGLARVMEGITGGLAEHRAGQAEKANLAADKALMSQWFGGGAPATTPAPATVPIAGPQADAGSSANAIASIESGGKYDALGPVTKTGDRAYGKYQVMGSNVGPWSEAALGKPLTPDAFLADPKAQDAVFISKFGEYAKKYGPEGAARAWFAGEGGMNDPSRKDQLGTSVADYAAKFNGALGLAGPPAAPPPAAPASPAVPAVAKAMGGLNPSILTALTSPYSSEGTKKIAGLMLQQQLGEQKPTDEMREYELYKRQGGNSSFFDYKSGLKKAGAQNTVINNTVNPILKGVGERFNEGMDSARASVPQIQGIHEARKALDQGAITGAGAEPRLFASKVANLFGLGSEAAANTEVLRSSIGNSVLAKAKTLGANPSNADRDYIEKVVGGNIVLEETSIRRLLDMQEKWSRDAIRRANVEGAKVLKSQPEELKNISGLLTVEEPGSYEDFIKANPITAPTTAPATVPGKMRRYNLETGKIE